MRQIKKVFLLLVAVIIFSNLTSLNVYAATKPTKKQYKIAMEGYKEILKENPFKVLDTGFIAETFLLKDLDKDGIPELIINSEKPQILSYDLNLDTIVLVWNAEIPGTLYYSEEKNKIMLYEEYEGEKSWTFYEIRDVEDKFSESMFFPSATSYIYHQGSKDMKKGYYKKAIYKDTVKISKDKLEASIEKLMPNKVELKTTIKNTKKNRDKYFSDLAVFKKLG